MYTYYRHSVWGGAITTGLCRERCQWHPHVLNHLQTIERVCRVHKRRLYLFIYMLYHFTTSESPWQNDVCRRRKMNSGVMQNSDFLKNSTTLLQITHNPTNTRCFLNHIAISESPWHNAICCIGKLPSGLNYGRFRIIRKCNCALQTTHNPTKTRRLSIYVSKLDQHLQRWPSIRPKPTLDQRPVLTGMTTFN